MHERWLSRDILLSLLDSLLGYDSTAELRQSWSWKQMYRRHLPSTGDDDNDGGTCQSQRLRLPDRNVAIRRSYVRCWQDEDSFNYVRTMRLLCCSDHNWLRLPDRNVTVRWSHLH